MVHSTRPTRTPRTSIVPAAHEPDDAVGDLRLLADEAVRRAAFAGFHAHAVLGASAAFDDHRLLARAAGLGDDVGRKRGGVRMHVSAACAITSTGTRMASSLTLNTVCATHAL